MGEQLRASTAPKTTSDTLARQSARTLLGNGGTRQLPPSHVKTDIPTGENFSHLKLTAEKMMQEQACVKSDLQILKTKLQKSEEHVRTLEAKMQDTNNDNAMLKVKHKEDMKLWKALDSKFLATTTFCDQLAETLQLLEAQVQEAENSKSCLEEKLAETLKFFEDTKSQLDDLLYKRKVAEDSIEQCEAKNAKLHHTLQELEQRRALESIEFEKLTADKDDLQQELSKATKTIEDDQELIQSAKSDLKDLQKQLVQTEQGLADLQNQNSTLVQGKGELEYQIQDLRDILATNGDEKKTLHNKLEEQTLKISGLEKAIASAAGNIEDLLAEQAKSHRQAKEDKLTHVRAVHELKQYIAENEMDAEMVRHQLQEKTKEIDRLVTGVAEDASRFASLKEEANQLQQECTKRSQLISELKQNEESLKSEISELQKQLIGLENDAKDLKKVFKLQLEAKQTELINHLQEISQRNNQEMADMRRKYEAETKEAVSKERKKGEVAGEAIQQASAEKLARELEAVNQHWRCLQEDHSRAVDEIRQSHEQEKANLSALHAEELHTKLTALRTEIEEQKGNVVRELQLKIDELQRNHREEIGNLHQDHQKNLSKITREGSSLQKKIKKMQDEHKEELARRDHDQKAQWDSLEKDHKAQIQSLQISLTNDIEEWRSKALLTEKQLNEALIITAREVSKEDKQTQIITVDLSASEVGCKENIQTPVIKDRDSIQQNHRPTPRRNVFLTSSREEDRHEDCRRTIPQDKEPMQQILRSAKRNLDLRSSTEEVLKENDRPSRSMTKGSAETTTQLPKEQRPKNSEVPVARTSQRITVYNNDITVEQRVTAVKEIMLPLPVSTPTQKGNRSDVQVVTSSDGNKTFPKHVRRNSNGVATREGIAGDSSKSAKKMKFSTGDLSRQKAELYKAPSPAISDLFQMDDLDPYYTGDDPYAFR